LFGSDLTDPVFCGFDESNPYICQSRTPMSFLFSFLSFSSSPVSFPRKRESILSYTFFIPYFCFLLLIFVLSFALFCGQTQGLPLHIIMYCYFCICRGTMNCALLFFNLHYFRNFEIALFNIFTIGKDFFLGQRRFNLVFIQQIRHGNNISSGFNLFSIKFI